MAAWRRVASAPGHRKFPGHFAKPHVGAWRSRSASLAGRLTECYRKACVRKELVELEIGKVRKDAEVVGFSMTVRAE